MGGLNDFKLRPQLVRPVNANKNGVTPAFTSGTTGIHNLQPGDYAVIYDMNPLYSANFTGAGVTIGVIGQTDIVMADITDFRSAAQSCAPGIRQRWRPNIHYLSDSELAPIQASATAICGEADWTSSGRAA